MDSATSMTMEAEDGRLRDAYNVALLLLLQAGVKSGVNQWRINIFSAEVRGIISRALYIVIFRSA